MTNYFDLATKYIQKEFGDEVAIVKESIKDLDDFFCFTYQSKKFIDSQNLSYYLVGHGYVFIYKIDDRIFFSGQVKNLKKHFLNLKKD